MESLLQRSAVNWSPLPEDHSGCCAENRTVRGSSEHGPRREPSALQEAVADEGSMGQGAAAGGHQVLAAQGLLTQGMRAVAEKRRGKGDSRAFPQQPKGWRCTQLTRE